MLVVFRPVLDSSATKERGRISWVPNVALFDHFFLSTLFWRNVNPGPIKGFVILQAMHANLLGIVTKNVIKRTCKLEDNYGTIS